MSFSIRGAEALDWPYIRDLLQQAGLPVDDLNEASMSEFLVAESPQGDVLGTIGIESYGSSALLRSLVISPSSRHGGLGRALIERLEAKAVSTGVTELWLLTIDADGFFARIGYTVRGREDAPSAIRETDEFSSLCPASAHLMSRRLGG